MTKRELQTKRPKAQSTVLDLFITLQTILRTEPERAKQPVALLIHNHPDVYSASRYMAIFTEPGQVVIEASTD